MSLYCHIPHGRAKQNEVDWEYLLAVLVRNNNPLDGNIDVAYI